MTNDGIPSGSSDAPRTWRLFAGTPGFTAVCPEILQGLPQPLNHFGVFSRGTVVRDLSAAGIREIPGAQAVILALQKDEEEQRETDYILRVAPNSGVLEVYRYGP